MRKVFIGWCMAFSALAAVMTGCNEERTSYTGSNYIMFSDTLNVLPVQNNEEFFDIPVTATQVCDYDRTIAVEVDETKSNAIDGKHYELASNTVVIKAGERVGSVRIRGFYDNIAVEDSLGLNLRLLVNKNDYWDLYEDNYDSKVVLQKVCPFDIHAFEGYALLTSNYMQEFMPNVKQRLIVTEIDPKEKNTVIFKDYFYDGYDVKVKFTTDDVLNPLIEMKEQVFASTPEAFGTIYGDGYLHLYQYEGAPSYYSSCEHFIFQYMTLYVPGMAPGANVVGTFANAMEWISDDEAKKIKLEGSVSISQSAKFAD